MFRNFYPQNSQQQFVPAWLPDELTYIILNHFSIPEIISFETVSKASFDFARDMIRFKPLSELTEFLIFHPDLGFFFLDWLLCREIAFPILDRASPDNPLIVLFVALQCHDVRRLNYDVIDDALDKIDEEDKLSNDLIQSLIQIFRIMRVSTQQPMIFPNLMNGEASRSLFLNLPHANFSLLRCDFLNFKFANLRQAIFSDAILMHPNLSYSKLSYSIFTRARMKAGNFSYSDLHHSDFSQTILNACIFRHTAAINVNFSNSSKFFANDFYKVDLSSATLKNNKIISCQFIESDLSGVDLSATDIKDTSFSRSYLKGVTLNGARLFGVNFVGAVLDGIDFSQCFLDSNISGLNFSSASLIGCSFQGKRLRQALFRYCGASDVNFRGADLTDADFVDANLPRANFDGAIIPGFKCENGVFSLVENDFKDLQAFRKNRSVILVLQYYLARLKDENVAANKNRIEAIEMLVSFIDAFGEDPIEFIMDAWGMSLLSDESMTCEEAMKRFQCSTSEYLFSFFNPQPMNNEINVLIEAIYQAQMKRESALDFNACM